MRPGRAWGIDFLLEGRQKVGAPELGVGGIMTTHIENLMNTMTIHLAANRRRLVQYCSEA